MRTPLHFLALGLALLLPASATALSVSPISNQTVNANHPLTANVVAVDPDGGSITLTATLPAFGTLNDPKTGSGSVVTTFTLSPADADVGTHSGSITATAGQLTDTEEFQIVVAVADANQPPRVTAPALQTGTEGMLLTFDVTAADADTDPITALTATGLPNGASFTPNGTYTSGSFSWTPDLTQAGHYDVTFAASNAQSDSANTHITVAQSDLGPVAIDPIADVDMAAGDSVQIKVVVTDPDEEEISLSALLPSFGTLNSPTDTTGTDSLQTSITLKPGSGDAGTHQASVTATSGEDTATEAFTITVTEAGGDLEATATLIGAFNTHKKRLCFKVTPVDESFDLLAVSLSTITLTYAGQSIPAIRPTHVAFDCDDDDDDDGDDGEECCDDDGDDGDHDDAALLRSGGMFGDDGPEGDHDGDGDCDEDDEECVPSHIMACFDMDDIRELFGDAALPDSLVAATIEGELESGETFVATIGGKHVHDGPRPRNHDDNRISLRIKPNPMNPKTDITFTLARSSNVRVAVYDLSGRLVGTVHEGEMAAGPHTIPWEGKSRSGGHVASGIYFVSVETSYVREVQRVTVLK